MKKLKKIIMIIALCLISVFMSGCSSNSRTCFQCGEDFRGNAYYCVLMRDERVMDEECARRYWFPLSIENMRVR